MNLSIYLNAPSMIRRIRRNIQLRPAELRTLQTRKIRALVKHCYDHVPYYRSLFKEAALRPEDVKSIDDLDKIPSTSKNDIRNAPLTEITASNIDLSECWTSRTSGTTGIPMSIYWNMKARVSSWIQTYIWQLRCGDRMTDRRVVLAGWMPSPPRLLQKIGIFPTKRVSPLDDLQTQIEQIRKYGPETMIAWPSCVAPLCTEVVEKNPYGINLRLVFTGGELLDERTRDLVKQAFEVELFDIYGASEVGGISRECVEHTDYHIMSDMVVVEITEDGRRVSAGEEGEVTVTNLDNYAMPFLRYNLEDLGIVTGDECACGCCFPLMRIASGRISDVIHLASGRTVSAQRAIFDLNQIEGVKQFQVTQEKTGFLKVMIVKDSRSNNDTCDEIKALFRQRLGSIEVDVTIVDKIQRGRTGKLTPFITKVTGSEA